MIRHRQVAPGDGVLTRFRRDQRGVSAVEFALIAPVMIMLYFGIAEFCQGYMAQKRVGHATAQIADIASQNGVVTRDQLDDIFAIAGLILSPFPTESLQMQLSGVTRDSRGVAKVEWSYGSMTARRPGDVVTVPAGVIANGESVVMSEATYDYQSPLHYVIKQGIEFNQRFFLRPRLVNKVTCSDC